MKNNVKNAAAKKPTIVQRAKMAMGLQTELSTSLEELEKLKLENTELKEQLEVNQSAALEAEMAAHAETRKALEAAMAGAEVTKEKVSAEATEMLAEAGFPCDQLPASNSEELSDSAGLKGRALMLHAVRRDNPEMFPRHHLER
jgi:cell division septum initiation protein DivIVA